MNPPETDGGVLAFGYRRRALIQVTIIAAGLLAGAVYLGILMLGGLGIATVVFVVYLPLSFVFMMVVSRALARGLRGDPLLSLDGDGVTLHSARVTLPWSNVAEVRIEHRPRRGDLLVFVPADERLAVEGLRGVPGKFARDGIQRVGGPIFVRTPQLAAPIEEVLSAVRRLSDAPVRHRQVRRP